MIPLAFSKALKAAARDRIKRLNNKSLFDLKNRSTKLELAQTIVELLELATECPDQEVNHVLHHLMCAEGYVARTSKCFQVILIKALLACKFKPGFSADELIIASDLPYPMDPPCPECLTREAEALIKPADKMDRVIGCILSVVDAEISNDPRRVKIPSRREVLQNQLCNDVFTDYIRTGNCSLDPLTTAGHLPAFNILERGKLRKKIDELIGATPDQSEALAELQYELIKYWKEPKVQAQILLKYAQTSGTRPAIAIDEIYFNRDGTCKLPWIETTINDLIAKQDTPTEPDTNIKPDTQPAPTDKDTKPNDDERSSSRNACT